MSTFRHTVEKLLLSISATQAVSKGPGGIEGGAGPRFQVDRKPQNRSGIFLLAELLNCQLRKDCLSNPCQLSA